MAVADHPLPGLTPLESIEVSNPWVYRDDVIGAYCDRLHNEAPVHYCAASDCEPFWSLSRYDGIIRVNAAAALFSCDHHLGGHIPGYQKLFSDHGVDAPMFQSTDAPKHTEQRKPIAPLVARLFASP